MNTITLPTTLHCGGCVASIKPFFDASAVIKQWHVDLAGPVKSITVTGEQITENDIVALLREAGYDKLNGKAAAPAPVMAGTLPSIGATESFWSDTDKWKRAAFNTLNCLIGCSFGDFSAVIFMQAFFPGTHMAAQMIVATVTGLCTSVALETFILKRREGFEWKQAFNTALSMSFISMIAMELAMNLSDFMVTGGKAAFNTPQYWIAFVIASIVGFLAPLPYNYYKLKKYNKACH